MYKYTLAVTSPEYWNTIHNSLIVDSNEDGIPDRKVTCSDLKEHSPTRGTYLLTEEEANEISKHPQVNIRYLCATKKIGKNIIFFDKRIKKKLPRISHIKNIIWKDLDVVFLSLPNGEAQKLISKYYQII